MRVSGESLQVAQNSPVTQPNFTVGPNSMPSPLSPLNSNLSDTAIGVVSLQTNDNSNTSALPIPLSKNNLNTKTLKSY